MKKLLLKYTFESILIVAGIILSFYIQGRIDLREDKHEAKTILKQIYNDLQKDTILFSQQLINADYVMNACGYLLEYDYHNVKNEDVDTLLFLTGETMYNLTTPFHESGYTRWNYFGKKNVINNEDLINEIVTYYTINKTTISGYQNTDVKFVDGPLTEAYLKPENYEIMNGYYRTEYSMEEAPENAKRDIENFLANKEIRSLLIYNISLKDAYKMVIQDTKNHASLRMKSIDSWLAKN